MNLVPSNSNVPVLVPPLSLSSLPMLPCSDFKLMNIILCEEFSGVETLVQGLSACGKPVRGMKPNINVHVNRIEGTAGAEIVEVTNLIRD